MKILISTDSSCLLNRWAFKDFKDVSVFPLNVIINGVEYFDGVSISQEQLAIAMRSGKEIKTSTPPVGSVIDYFKKHFDNGYDYILHFTISSKLSSMNTLFTNIAKEYFNKKVFVIDSMGVSSVMLSQILYAYDEAQKGTEISRILEGVESFKKYNYLVFIPENLDSLKRGGRISASVAVIGNLLGIKPVIRLIDGQLQKEATARNVKKAFVDIVNKIKNNYPTDNYDYSLISFDAKGENVNYVYNNASEILGVKLIRGQIPINVCAHCGPGTIGLSISKKINNKSLIDFFK